ncbi:nucleotidyltransferase [Ectobacillus funiculus]|uniref:nucleotidyltransferase n=1 Tax=Ectobacillus funiculus TaxID=137993 RepID=UPI00101DAABD|nr:nucleotidyltransferase [Ectobacillus funiculus]
MKTAGVIVEYNPFHNGHAYHLQETKNLTAADVTIAVMSGSFLQRGEPALVSKWARTKMALLGGVDLVVELPYAFAVQQASIFANGAISILEALGVQELCFGSESGQIEQFLSLVKLRQTHQDAFDAAVRSFMQQGMSYPKALSEAFAAIQGEHAILDMSKPNNILGFHYVQAIVEQGSSIIPRTVPRLSAQYHDETFASASIASATSIRKHLTANSLSSAAGVIPPSTLIELENYYETYGIFHNWERYFPFLKYKLLTMSPAQLSNIYEVQEGLEHRILSAVKEASSFISFMEALKTKRYTWTRLQRLLVHVLTHTTKEEMRVNTPAYIRLLGMSKKGQSYLSAYKKAASLPLVANIKSASHPLLQLDIKAGSVYYSVLPEPLQSMMLKRDFTQHPIRYDEVAKRFQI